MGALGLLIAELGAQAGRCRTDFFESVGKWWDADSNVRNGWKTDFTFAFAWNVMLSFWNVSRSVERPMNVFSLVTKAWSQPAPPQPAQQLNFFTWQSFGTLAVATTMVVMVANVMRTLLGWNSKWVPFGVSLAVTLLGLLVSKDPIGWREWVVAPFNACLLFCSATGMNETGARYLPRAYRLRSWFTPDGPWT